MMEEKSNRILEVLLSSASATEILTGKVLGVALLTLTVLAAWGGLGGFVLLSAAPQIAVQVGQVLLHDGLVFYFIAYQGCGSISPPSRCSAGWRRRSGPATTTGTRRPDR